MKGDGQRSRIIQSRGELHQRQAMRPTSEAASAPDALPQAPLASCSDRGPAGNDDGRVANGARQPSDPLAGSTKGRAKKSRVGTGAAASREMIGYELSSAPAQAMVKRAAKAAT
jgi:hypothetical protein